MHKRRCRALGAVGVAVVGALLAGCSFGPRALEKTRLRYNEAVKTTSEEQMLLNIVRLRYIDTPSSLAVSNIASQFEVQRSLQLMPFFAASGDMNPRGFSAVLPQFLLFGADRPTMTYTPLDDQEFTRKLFTPLPLEGAVYLARATWPISTVFRLWLENLNWVSNAQTASGPTPKQPPVYAEFLRGMLALQALQDRGQIVIQTDERFEKLSEPVAANQVNPKDIVEAAKGGYEFRKDDKGDTWSLSKKINQPVLRIHPQALGSPEMLEFAHIFKLKPRQAKYDIKVDKLDPFPENYPPEGVDTIDLETRSLLQVLYFVSQGVEIPPEHVHAGLTTMTVDEAGQVFDWQQVLGGLFKVCWAKSKQRPATAHVAIQYQGYWFYIDETDLDSKTTFSLIIELARLEVTGKTGTGPLLTLPLSGS